IVSRQTLFRDTQSMNLEVFSNSTKLIRDKAGFQAFSVVAVLHSFVRDRGARLDVLSDLEGPLTGITRQVLDRLTFHIVHGDGITDRRNVESVPIREVHQSVNPTLTHQVIAELFLDRV